MAKDVKLIDTNALLFYHQQLKTLLADKISKVEGKSLISDTEIIRLANVDNYNDSAVKSAIEIMKGQITSLKAGTFDDTQLRSDLKGYTDTEILKVINRLTSAMHYKGSVDNYTDLPTDATEGDCYNIKNASDNNKAGDNAIFTKDKTWDVVAGTVNLSDYLKETDLVIAENSDIEEIFKSNEVSL